MKERTRVCVCVILLGTVGFGEIVYSLPLRCRVSQFSTDQKWNFIIKFSYGALQIVQIS